ncbi:MAG: hypothetical protein K8I03_16165 [Ignavibacteria bacterium]|nr:hypothetical protein [Ignavibacteria bacterium]
MKYAIILAVFFSSSSAFAQNTSEIQAMLTGHLKRMAYYKYDAPNPDSIDIHNSFFKKLLIKYLTEHPSTLNTGLNKVVKAGLMIASSPDSLFRIYSWDTQSGGTMRFYDNVYQYRSVDKVYCRVSEKDTSDVGDPLSWYSEIYTMSVGAKKYYLGVYNADYSNRDKAQGIKFFTIENYELNTDVKLAKTKDSTSNDLGISYDFFSVVDRDERPFKLVTYDTDNRTISMPIVDENGKVTDKFTLYKFVNGFFEEVKIDLHK